MHRQGLVRNHPRSTSAATRSDARGLADEDETAHESIDGVLIVVNVAMLCLHATLMLVTLSVGNTALRLPLYRTALRFEAATADSGYRLVPQLEPLGDVLPLTQVTALFFAVSALAHAAQGVLFRQTYLRALHRCTAPLRWIEYSISAPLMMLLIAYLAGIREVTALCSVCLLVMSTMPYGWLAELSYRRGESRLHAHLFGWIPHLAAWGAVLGSFFSAALAGACAPPTFVYFIVLGEAVLFSLFALPQVYQLLHPPSAYVNGEISFQLLSLVSKATLGLLMLANVLQLDALDEGYGVASGDASGDTASGAPVRCG